MDRQPSLRGEGLLLRPLAESDREALFEVAGDPELWAQHPVNNRWQRPVYDAMFDEALGAGGALIGIDEASGEVVASSQYRPSAVFPGAMEIGWTFIRRNRWGGATNRALKRLMLTHALQSVEQVVFRVGATNLRSRRAMEKIGGVLSERTEDIAYADGRTITHVIYVIDREGYASGPLVS